LFAKDVCKMELSDRSMLSSISDAIDCVLSTAVSAITIKV